MTGMPVVKMKVPWSLPDPTRWIDGSVWSVAASFAYLSGRNFKFKSSFF